MAKSKIHTVKVGETKRVVLVTILFLLLFVLLLSSDIVARGVSKVTGVEEETIKEIPSRVFGVIASVCIIVLGLTLLPLSTVGVVAIAVGVLAGVLWYKYKTDNQVFDRLR